MNDLLDSWEQVDFAEGYRRGPQVAVVRNVLFQEALLDMKGNCLLLHFSIRVKRCRCCVEMLLAS